MAGINPLDWPIFQDGQSRSSGQGSYNYVVFDPDLIEIQRKYANHPDAARINASLQAMQAERDQQQSSAPRQNILDTMSHE